MSSPFPVISSEVERSSSARLLPEGRKKSHEISPCASLSRDDIRGALEDPFARKNSNIIWYFPRLFVSLHSK